MFLITVSFPDGQTLKFKVLEYQRTEGRITFYDTYTGYLKDFPSEWCSAEEVKA